MGGVVLLLLVVTGSAAAQEACPTGEVPNPLLLDAVYVALCDHCVYPNLTPTPVGALPTLTPSATATRTPSPTLNVSPTPSPTLDPALFVPMRHAYGEDVALFAGWYEHSIWPYVSLPAGFAFEYKFTVPPGFQFVGVCWDYGFDHDIAGAVHAGMAVISPGFVDGWVSPFVQFRRGCADGEIYTGSFDPQIDHIVDWYINLGQSAVAYHNQVQTWGGGEQVVLNFGYGTDPAYNGGQPTPYPYPAANLSITVIFRDMGVSYDPPAATATPTPLGTPPGGGGGGDENAGCYTPYISTGTGHHYRHAAGLVEGATDSGAHLGEPRHGYLADAGGGQTEYQNLLDHTVGTYPNGYEWYSGGFSINFGIPVTITSGAGYVRFVDRPGGWSANSSDAIITQGYVYKKQGGNWAWARLYSSAFDHVLRGHWASRYPGNEGGLPLNFPVYETRILHFTVDSQNAITTFFLYGLTIQYYNSDSELVTLANFNPWEDEICNPGEPPQGIPTPTPAATALPPTATPIATFTRTPTSTRTPTLVGTLPLAGTPGYCAQWDFRATPTRTPSPTASPTPSVTHTPWIDGTATVVAATHTQGVPTLYAAATATYAPYATGTAVQQGTQTAAPSASAAVAATHTAQYPLTATWAGENPNLATDIARATQLSGTVAAQITPGVGEPNPAHPFDCQTYGGVASCTGHDGAGGLFSEGLGLGLGFSLDIFAGECLRLIPAKDILGVSIPEVVVCIKWVAFPSIVLFGVRIPVEVMLLFPVMGLMRRIWQL